MVEIDPDPDSIALIIGHTSGPRISPTIWRETLNRNESYKASAMLNSPAIFPSGPRSPDPIRASQACTIACRC